jgi:rhodanese-related sulfurtransferase
MTEARANLSKGKQTVLGLYVTAKEAYEKWQAEPDKVRIIDVRTPEEYLFVGHPTMAWKIPVATQSYEWDAEKNQYPIKPLLDFASRVAEIAKPDDTLMLMCRSGGRSAMAVNLLAKAGFKNVHNIIDGMEGDANADSDSVAQAQQLNGWKNSGCPWTKKLTPERMVLPRSDRATPMTALALKVFRQPPERLNCAQSTVYAWREVVGDTSITVADLKPFGAGRSPEGLCGSLYAACLLAPKRAEELKAAFAARLGSLYCKEIRAAKKHPCAECVAQAADLLSAKT